MKFSAVKSGFPSASNSLLAILSAVLLILAFPGFEWWFLAWFALVPLFFAVEREKESFAKSFVLGWIFGVCFFFGSCWWLTHAPVTYAHVPSPIAYALLFLAASVVGLFPAIFSLVFAHLLKRLGGWAILSAPFLWTATEFLRFWATGNNWNAIGYSRAFTYGINQLASVGGIYLVGFCLVSVSSLVVFISTKQTKKSYIIAGICLFLLVVVTNSFDFRSLNQPPNSRENEIIIVAVQPNVPMGGLRYEDWQGLRERHVRLAEDALSELAAKGQIINGEKQKTIVVFPESPMNFQYEQDREFQEFLGEFARKNNVSVLFNAAEPANDSGGLYNSAVLVNEKGEKQTQYNKIHLVPFGEFVPLPEPLASIVPTMVGNFQTGESYNLIPLGSAKAGIMICFESHFPGLTRQFTLDGADVLVELTNDGYLGNTPVLRQHLANAVFRAIETNRPVVRVTNTGITAFINERGEILDAIAPFAQEARVWTIKKSDASRTFYVKYGDWLAWACSGFSLIFLALSFRKGKEILTADARR